MFNLKMIAFKLLRAAKAQVITSISIIAISICLVMTMGVYTWNAKVQLESDIYALFGDAEMTVGYNPEQQQWVTKDQLTAISEMEGVKKVSPVLITGTDVEGLLPTVYTIGIENDSLVKSRYHIETNLAENEVIISQKIASLFDKAVGDTIDIESSPYIIKEILVPLPGASDEEMVILSNDTVKQWLDFIAKDAVGLFTLIDLEKNVSPSSLTEELIALDGELLIDIANEHDFVKANFQALSIFIIVLSVFILIITTVLLISTFQLVFFKLKEQLMVFRALGASAKQVGQIVQIQLMTIIATGVVLGFALSLTLIKQWLPLLIDKMMLPEAQTEFPLWLAISIAVISFILLQGVMQWQVKKSMQLLPLQITKENHKSSLRLTKTKIYILGIVLACALISFFSAIFEENDSQRALQMMSGSLLVCIIVLYLIPFIFSFLLKTILQPVRMIFGKEAYLACKQLMPQVRKNMPIVISIIGLMVILIFGTALFKTIQQNEKAYIEYIYEAPIVIHNDLEDPTLTIEVIQKIEELPTVDAAYARSNYPIVEFFMQNQWQTENFSAIDVKQFIELGKIKEIYGDIEEGVVVSEQFAKEHSLKIGDWLQTGKFNFELQMTEEIEPAQIIGITDSLPANINFFVDWSSNIASASNLTINEIMVETSNIDQAMTDLEFLHETWPALTFTDYETFIEENNQMFYQRWSLFVGVMVILIIATCLGVLQTLMHSINGKRDDYAIQRLIGLSPNGLMKLILTQVLSFVLYGISIGIIIGYTFTQLLAFIDTDTVLVFNHKIMLTVSSLFLFVTCLIFLLQGYWISRKRLANELID